MKVKTIGFVCCLLPLLCSAQETHSTPTVDPSGDSPESVWMTSDFVQASVKADCFTAYSYRGVTYGDRPVVQITPMLDVFLSEWFFLGGWAWQNYDLTNRRRPQGIRGEWNETDYEAHVGVVPWSNGEKDERKLSALVFTGGYCWETYVVHGTYPWGERKRKYYPTLRYMNFTGEFTNPYLVPYLTVQLEHIQYHTLMAEAGVKKEVPLDDLTGLSALEDFSLAFKLGVFGGHRRGLALLFGAEDAKTGVSAMEGGVSLDWHPVKNLTVGLGVTYTSLISTRIAHDMRANAEILECSDHPSLVWGGVHAVWSF